MFAMISQAMHAIFWIIVNVSNPHTFAMILLKETIDFIVKDMSTNDVSLTNCRCARLVRKELPCVG